MLHNAHPCPVPSGDGSGRRQKSHWRLMHADSVLDNYYWMYDYFGKGPDSTKAVNYLKAENGYLDTVMRNTKKFQDDLFAEMKARIKEKDESVPWIKMDIIITPGLILVLNTINTAGKKEA